MRHSHKFLGFFLRENENTAKQTQLYDDNFSPSWKEIARSLGLQMFTGNFEGCRYACFLSVADVGLFYRS